LQVNQSRVLRVEFDQATGRETFYDRERQPLLTVTFNHAGLPQSWVPANGGQPVNITYDRWENNTINLFYFGIDCTVVLIPCSYVKHIGIDL
jgi:hypothetical protein